MTDASAPAPLMNHPGRNYRLLTAAAIITGLGTHGALIAAAFAVLESGGDGGDVGLVAAARTAPLVVFLLIGGAIADRLPRHQVMVAANDWFGSVAMLPVATALAGPVEALVGRSEALWGCAGLIVLVTGAVLFVPEVRNLTRAAGTTEVVRAKVQGPSSADAEGPVGRLG